MLYEYTLLLFSTRVAAGTKIREDRVLTLYKYGSSEITLSFLGYKTEFARKLPAAISLLRFSPPPPGIG